MDHNHIPSQQIHPSPYTAIAVHLLWLMPLIIMSLLVAACNTISDSVFDKRINSGLIEYKVTFPELGNETITASVLPETMTYAFHDNMFSSSFETMGGIFKNRILSDYNSKTLSQELKVFRKKIRVDMSEPEILRSLTGYPNMTVIKTSDLDTIAGFACQKAILVFEDVHRTEIEVYYTTDIKMKSPNWCTQYHDIDGVLMAYEVEEFGIRMRLEAVNVKPLPGDNALFAKTEQYYSVSKEAMNVELEELVSTFEL